MFWILTFNKTVSYFRFQFDSVSVISGKLVLNLCHLLCLILKYVLIIHQLPLKLKFSS